MENNLEYIDAYFGQRLNAEEVRRFEERVERDKDFAEEVAFYVSARQVLKGELDIEKKDRFKQLLSQGNVSGGTFPVTQARRVWIYRLAAAAAVLVCVFLAWSLFFTKSASPQEMADRYINTELETLSIKMGPIDSMQNGLRLYNESKYDSAVQQFETIIQKDTANYVAKQYLGIVYLRVGNYDKALLYFQQLEKYPLFANPAIFYQALTFMKRNQPGDKQRAKQLLQQVVDKDLEGKTDAAKWLKGF